VTCKARLSKADIQVYIFMLAEAVPTPYLVNTFSDCVGDVFLLQWHVMLSVLQRYLTTLLVFDVPVASRCFGMSHCPTSVGV